MIAKQASSLISLLKNDVLQKTLRVISCINCLTKENDIFLYKLAENMLLNNRDIAILKNDENDKDLKSLIIVDNGVKYLFGENIFSDDIFKSKHNQEILKIANLMNETEFKNLDCLIIDATYIFEKFVSKILKISDNILILADTSQESLNKIISKFRNKDLYMKNFEIVLMNKDNDRNINWEEYFNNLKNSVEGICNINVRILNLILNGFSNIEMYRTGEKIYINSLATGNSKNVNFFDFIINILN